MSVIAGLGVSKEARFRVLFVCMGVNYYRSVRQGLRGSGLKSGYKFPPLTIVHSEIDRGDDCRIVLFRHILDCERAMGTVD